MSKPGRWFAIHVSSRVDPVLIGLTGGRVHTFMTAPVVMLTVRGAKSGKARTIALLHWHDGEDVILIASASAATSTRPWYYNLRSNPEVR